MRQRFGRAGAKLNMFTVGNDCARLVAIKALLQGNLQWRLFLMP